MIALENMFNSLRTFWYYVVMIFYDALGLHLHYCNSASMFIVLYSCYTRLDTTVVHSSIDMFSV